MRCAKCGYISFDHQESCPKCRKSISSSVVKGTTYAAVAPSFLQFSEQIDVSGNIGIEEDMVNVLDPDLAVLVDENDEISMGDDFDLAFDSKGSDLSFDEDDLGLDTSRFEAVPVNVRAEQAVQPVIPEELADISDLARPAAVPEVESTIDLNFDDDLNLDDLDLSLGAQKGGITDSSVNSDELATLSLDDIDLSGDLGLSSPPPAASPRPVNDDLDLDLGDLGGQLSGGAKKKRADDFADIDLSLD